MLVFPSLSYEIWKPIPDLPFWRNPSPPTKLYFATKTAKNFTFSVFSREKKEKHHFRAKKNEKKHKKLKILDFLRKMADLGHFFLQNRSPVLPRFFPLPGSCPVLARFLPGSCPVLPGSRLVFWGFLNFFGFFVPFCLGPEKITKKSEILDRKEKNQQNSEIFARNAKDRKTRKVARISLVWVNKTQKLLVLSCG